MQGFTFGGTSVRSSNKGVSMTETEVSAVIEHFTENASNMSEREAVYFLFARGWTTYQVYKSGLIRYRSDSKKLNEAGEPVRLAGAPFRLQHINHLRNDWELKNARSSK
jgi:hypothetical protein